MDKSQLSFFADIIGIISDIMTLLGIGGILSWSFFKQDRQPFSETVVSISSYSIKTAICFAIFLFAGSFVYVMHELFVAPSFGIIGILLTVIFGMILTPLSLVLYLCVYQGSSKPGDNLMELLRIREENREDS